MNALYVIIRDTGEYEDRRRDPIRYVTTEREAIEACERALEEGKTLAKPAFPKLANSWGWQMPDGSWCDGETVNSYRASWARRPDGDAREAERERLVAEYNAACLAMGCVDPEGPDGDAEYVYQKLLPL